MYQGTIQKEETLGNQNDTQDLDEFYEIQKLQQIKSTPALVGYEARSSVSIGSKQSGY